MLLRDAEWRLLRDGVLPANSAGTSTVPHESADQFIQAVASHLCCDRDKHSVRRGDERLVAVGRSLSGCIGLVLSDRTARALESLIDLRALALRAHSVGRLVHV